LVIDDASPDGTGDLAEELRSRCARLSVIHRVKKDGLGKAYVHGFREALRRGYRRVVTMDADLSHAPEDVPRLLAALDRAEVAVGSRLARGGGTLGWPLWRRALSRAGSLYARSLLSLPVRDVTSGFRAYRAEALEALDLDAIASRGFVFQVEVLRRILDLPGARAEEVPIVFRDRSAGRSKLSVAVVLEAIREVPRLRRRARAAAHRRPAALPSVSMIVAAPPRVEPNALRALARTDYPRGLVEVLVARGSAPSRQRNVAASRSRGEVLVFLDDDSAAPPDLLRRYATLLAAHPEAAAAGGPSEGAPGGSFQTLASLVLSEPWVAGKSASRYRARGKLRSTDERELIGANLCVRREAFEAAGGFDERLYPNEENDLLERLRKRGWDLLYDPGACVERPQRPSLRALLRAVFGYGRGRAAQARCLLSRATALRLLAAGAAAAAAVSVAAAFAAGSAIFLVPLVAYGIVLIATAVKLGLRGGPRSAVPGALLALGIHAAYAAGLLWGLVTSRRPPPSNEVDVERRELEART
jgi:dolichol-phosphate mannosyltransferase